MWTQSLRKFLVERGKLVVEPAGFENFLLALKNTAIYSFATVALSTVLALPLAVFLANRGRLSAFYQTVYFLPVMLASPSGSVCRR